MSYNIRGENIEVTESIRDYAEKKIGRIERYLEDTNTLNVHINSRTFHDKTAKVEVTLTLKHLVLRAEEKTEDMYAAIDLVAEKLERQIRKHKTKVNRKWREKGKELQFVAVSSGTTENGHDEEELEIVRKKRFDLEPMDPEEAVLQMNMLGHNFFIFSDSDTEETHIVYKRKDGKYGLIQVEE